MVARLTKDEHARDGESDRGEATYGPPRGAAAPREDIEDTSGGLQGHVDGTTSLRKPLAASGGRPQKRRDCASPQELPASLGAGPSIPGRALSDDEGGRPASRGTVRRREGGVEAVTRAVAARGSGGAATASPTEMPLEGIRRRVQSARTHECRSIEQMREQHRISDSNNRSDGDSKRKACTGTEQVSRAGGCGQDALDGSTTVFEATARGKGSESAAEDHRHRHRAEDGRPAESGGRPPKRGRSAFKKDEGADGGEDFCGEGARPSSSNEAPKAPALVIVEIENGGSQTTRDSVTARGEERASAKASATCGGRGSKSASKPRPGQREDSAQSGPREVEASNSSAAAAQPRPRLQHGRRRPTCSPPRGPIDVEAADVSYDVPRSCDPANMNLGSRGSKGGGPRVLSSTPPRVGIAELDTSVRPAAQLAVTAVTMELRMAVMLPTALTAATKEKGKNGTLLVSTGSPTSRRRPTLPTAILEVAVPMEETRSLPSAGGCGASSRSEERKDAILATPIPSQTTVAAGSSACGRRALRIRCRKVAAGTAAAHPDLLLLLCSVSPMMIGMGTNLPRMHGMPPLVKTDWRSSVGRAAPSVAEAVGDRPRVRGGPLRVARALLWCSRPP